mmetsp:Transcript_19737/g.19850  ORF Transcript_19737/g.19850 Transcript_19737/m.19850 type:complete len:121 (+) Transcript_19737:225-587(+)
MLRVKKIPEVLRTMLSDGISGACLMTLDGSLLSAVFAENCKMTETLLAAVTSGIWNSYSQGNAEITFHIMKLDNGVVGVTTAGTGYLVALYGNEVSSMGMLRGRLISLSSYFATVFEQLK